MEENGNLSQDNKNKVMAYKKPITVVLLIALIAELFIPMGWVGKMLLMLATAVVIVLGFSVYISSKINKQ